MNERWIATCPTCEISAVFTDFDSRERWCDVHVAENGHWPDTVDPYVKLHPAEPDDDMLKAETDD